MLSASSTFLPRTRSATRRTFCGEAFRYLRVAVACMVVLRLLARRLGGLLDLLAGVALERTGQGELAELVADHVLGDVHRDELPPVVDGHRVTDHVRNDRRPPRPGLDDLLVALAIHRFDLLREVLVDEGSLFL